MPLYREFDEYYARTQRGQALVLRDPGESIQSKLPVAEGEIILTQTRLYLATGVGGDSVPSVRLERSDPRTFPDEEWLEIAPRMGARLTPGQTGREFLEGVETYRRAAIERREAARRPSAAGLGRRYDAILSAADAHGREGRRSAMKGTLRSLHAAVPERREAARRLGEAYLEDGNFRAAAVWLAAAGTFDARFDRALERIERLRLPSRETPPPERWLDRHLTPLLHLPDEEGPDPGQRLRIRAVRERIDRFRAARGKASPWAWGLFSAAAFCWILLLFLAPWLTLGATAAAAVSLGLFVSWRRRGRRPPKR